MMVQNPAEYIQTRAPQFRVTPWDRLLSFFVPVKVSANAKGAAYHGRLTIRVTRRLRWGRWVRQEWRVGNPIAEELRTVAVEPYLDGDLRTSGRDGA